MGLKRKQKFSWIMESCLTETTWREFLITFVFGQISEIHRFADFLVGGPAQLHVHGDRLGYVGVEVRRRLEHDRHLTMNVGLGKRTSGLPSVGGEKSHLDVICWEKRWWDDGMIVAIHNPVCSFTKSKGYFLKPSQKQWGNSAKATSNF